MKRVDRGRMLILACVVTLSVSACGDDNAPGPDHQVRIEEARFFQRQLEIRPGQTVEWVNVMRKADPNTRRTVTSGLIDSMETHGLLFDVTLDGFESGEGVGDSFRYTFKDPGVWDYFTRFPAGGEYSGTVTVR